MNKRKIFTLLVIITIVVLFWYSNLLQDVFYWITDLFNKVVVFNEALAILIFLLISVMASLVSPFTNIPLIPVAVVVWGSFYTSILLLIGWISGDIIAYLIGRYLGQPVIRYFVSKEKFEELISGVKEHTSFLTALFIRITLPAELGYVFGIVRYPFLSYLIITSISELPIAMISSYASEAVLSGNIMKFIYFIGILFLFFYSALHFRKNHFKNIDK